MKISPYVYPLLGKKTMLNIKRRVKPDIQSTIDILSQFFGVSMDDLTSASYRDRNIVEAKHLLRKILKEEHSLTLKNIGELTGADHHSTVLHSIKRATNLIETDTKYKKLYKQIIKNI